MFDLNAIDETLQQIPLRPYQYNYCMGAFRGWTQGGRTALGVKATGLGKTRYGTAVIRTMLEHTGGKALWIAHRKELNEQAMDAIRNICGCEPELEMGDSRVDTRKNLLGSGSRVIVASIQSLMAGRKCSDSNGTGGVLVECKCNAVQDCSECDGTGQRPSNVDCPVCTGGIIRRMQKFNPDDFSLIITDEGHRALAMSYRRCYKWFGRNEKAKFLLLTATPQRGDKQSLGIIADFAPDIHGVPQFGHDAERAQVADLQWGVENAWLVPVKQMFIECQSIDISGVSTNLGDLDTSEMSEVLMQEQAIHEMVMGTVKYTDNMKTVVFCNDVAHAERVAEVLNRYKPASARMVCGNKKKVTDEQRDEILTDHKVGKFQYLVNVDIVTEGYDDPSIECIVMMRAHKVLGPILQKIGRGTRPIKPADNDSELEERQAMIASSGKPHCTVIDFKVENGRHRLVTILDVLCGDVSQELLDRAKQVSIEQKQPESPEELLRLAQQQLLEEERKEQERKEAEKRAAIAARQAKFLVTERDPFSWFNSLPKTSSVDSTEASEQQKAALSRFGVEEARMAGITVASAGAMLKNLTERRNKKLCTYKQAMYLAKHGVDTRNLSFKTASSMMNALARNYYKMTDGIRAMAERKEKELV